MAKNAEMAQYTDQKVNQSFRDEYGRDATQDEINQLRDQASEVLDQGLGGSDTGNREKQAVLLQWFLGPLWVSIIAIVLLLRRKSKTLSPNSPGPPTVTAYLVCVRCQSQLPAGSKFCNECGLQFDPQPPCPLVSPATFSPEPRNVPGGTFATTVVKPVNWTTANYRVVIATVGIILIGCLLYGFATTSLRSNDITGQWETTISSDSGSASATYTFNKDGTMSCNVEQDGDTAGQGSYSGTYKLDGQNLDIVVNEAGSSGQLSVQGGDEQHLNAVVNGDSLQLSGNGYPAVELHRAQQGASPQQNTPPVGQTPAPASSPGSGEVGSNATSGLSWTNYTTANGLANNNISCIAVSGPTICAGTSGGGLAISTNGGATWTNYTTANGLASNDISCVAVSGLTIYAGSSNGLSVSTSDRSSWTNYTTASGLASNSVECVAVSGSTIYAGTAGGGLSISTNDGASWTNTNANGNGFVNSVAVSGSTICAGTNGSGLSISTDGGASWINHKLANAQAFNDVWRLAVSGATIYEGTQGTGMAISPDGGMSWTACTTGNGLADNFVNAIAISESTIGVGTDSGLSVSSDSGSTWRNYTTADGLAGNHISSVAISGSTIYIGTADGGLSISK